MYKSAYLVVLILALNHNGNAQVFCSELIPKVYFGPNNVIAEDEEIVVLHSILKSWKEQQPIINEYVGLNTSITVREFFDISNQEIQLKRSFPNKYYYDCLSADPNDCIVYDRVKRYNITLEDDYGRALDPSFHHFSSVGFSGDQQISQFYRERTLSMTE